MPPQSQAQKTQQRIQWYADRLATVFQQCAEDIHDRPDVFLWNARRCLECIAHAFMVNKTGGDYNVSPSDGQLNNFIDREIRSNVLIYDKINSIRNIANLAVHIQAENSSDYKSEIKSCADKMSRVVEWFFKESGIQCLEPESVQKSHEKLCRLPVSKEEQRKNEEFTAQKQREELAQLQDLVALHSSKFETEHFRREQLQQELKSAQAQSQDAEARYRQLIAEREQWERQRHDLQALRLDLVAENRALKARLTDQPHPKQLEEMAQLQHLVALHSSNLNAERLRSEQLQQELKRAQAQSQDAEARYRQLIAEREQWERQRRDLEALRHELEAERHALKARLAVQPQFSPTPPPAAEVPLVAPLRRSWPRAVAGLAGLGVVVVLGLGAMSATERRAPPPGETFVPSDSLSVKPSALFSVSASIPQPPALVPGTAPQPSQTPARGIKCPAGMIAMGPLPALQVPSPRRPAWPAVESPPRPVAVEQFCVDQAPVRSLAYGKCIQERGCSEPQPALTKGCNWDWKKPTTLNCLTRSEASQFCAWRGANVPTVVQWEVAQKSGKIHMDGRTGEWASENFPAPVFHRGPAKKDKGMIFARGSWEGMDEGWNQAILEGPSAQRADVSFRCACDPADLSCRGPENDLVGRAP